MCFISLNMSLVPAIWGVATLPNFTRSHHVLSATERRKKKKSRLKMRERKEETKKTKEEKRLSQ